MADDSFGERTEKATGRRRTEARKKGNVAKSREISSVAVLFTGLSVLYLLSGYVVRQLSIMMAQGLMKAGSVSLTLENAVALQGEILWGVFQVLAPIFAGIVAMAVLSNYVQVGNLLTFEALQPKFSRLNPISGFSRLMSKESFAELAKSILKLLIIGWVAYSTIRKEVPEIVALTDQEVGSIFGYISLISARILFKTLIVMILLAALDYAFQRWNYEKGLRMTKREVQEEFKQTEGDPQIKSRIRSIQRELARKRMMAEVPKADVVITNPTHLAVALHYQKEEMAAPRVLAKGAGYVAEKIREIALAHRIPIIENKPLAQALFKTVELGQSIPSNLYQIVADVLAHVYRLKKKVL